MFGRRILVEVGWPTSRYGHPRQRVVAVGLMNGDELVDNLGAITKALA
nr:hypothetical protein [Mycobacterium kubicae]